MSYLSSARSTSRLALLSSLTLAAPLCLALGACGSKGGSTFDKDFTNAAELGKDGVNPHVTDGAGAGGSGASTGSSGSNAGTSNGSTGTGTGTGNDVNASNNGDDPCGNGVLDGGEECDGTTLGGATCQSLGFSGGGALNCDPQTCTYDESMCRRPPGQGNSGTGG